MASMKNQRHKARCQAYRTEGRRLKNKAIKLARHQKVHTSDAPQNVAVNYTRKKPFGYYEKIFSQKA